MMAITAALVKELRGKTGAGMMDCKKALTETGGDIEKAVDFLREKGIAKAAKKADRIAAEGIVESYIHSNGRIGVLLEVNSETDYVAKNDEFKLFVKDVAMQIAALGARYVQREDVPDDIVQKEREIFKQQVLEEGKPEKIVDRIVDGKIDKFYKEICLLEQEFVKNDADNKGRTIERLLKEQISRIGEKLSIRRFVRFELGEGIEKREDNFVEEVMSQVKKA